MSLQVQPTQPWHENPHANTMIQGLVQKIDGQSEAKHHITGTKKKGAHVRKYPRTKKHPDSWDEDVRKSLVGDYPLTGKVKGFDDVTLEDVVSALRLISMAFSTGTVTFDSFPWHSALTQSHSTYFHGIQH
jgi:hypothetical protein